jgi:nucleoside-triphosphatase THEP1
MKIVIITGKKGEGKTTFLKEFVNNLHINTENIYGFYTENISYKKNINGYVINAFNSEKKLLLCKRNSPETGNLKLQDFYFDEKVIKSKNDCFRKGYKNPDAVFVIDEIGKFELDGFVWDKILKEILNNNTGKLIITVRDRFLENVIEKYFNQSFGYEIIKI